MEQPYGFLRLEHRQEVCWVAIQRPHDRNALHSPLLEELRDLLKALEQGGTRAVVFTGGSEQYFIGGADGIEMMRLGPEGAMNFSLRIQALFARMEASPLVLLAAIDGLCFGGGFEFALACDLRIATPRAKIGLPEVKVGLIPGGGGTQRLPRLVGIGRAMEMILSGKLYPGQEALDMGLVHRCVASEDLRAAAEGMLAPILRQPAYAVARAKKAVYASSQGSLETGLSVETAQFGRCFDHAFFRDLMRRQLQEGILETSEDVASLLTSTAPPTPEKAAPPRTGAQGGA